jgi:hypothetical protein
MHPLSNTREGMIQIPAAAANLTPGLLAKIDSNGKAALAGLSSAPVAGRYVVIESDATTATLLPIEPGRQVRVTLYGDCNPGEELACTVDSKAVRKADTTGLSSILVAEEAGVDGQMVLARGIAAYVEPAPPDELPAIAEGDAGKVLTVNAEEDGVEWATPAAGALPAQEPGNPNGSILEVTDGTPAWRDAPVEVPTPTEGENGFILSAVYDNPPQWSPAPMGLPDMTGVGPSAVLGVDADTPSWRSGASLVEMLEAIVAALPTSNPYDPGKLYVDGDTIKISAGI